jgi:hypothetical protein
MLYKISTGNNLPGIFRTGHLKKKEENLSPSNVADVITTFKSWDRLLTSFFINPNNISLQCKENSQVSISFCPLYWSLHSILATLPYPWKLTSNIFSSQMLKYFPKCQKNFAIYVHNLAENVYTVSSHFSTLWVAINWMLSLKTTCGHLKRKCEYGQCELFINAINW